MTRPIRTTRQARLARRRVPNPWAREFTHRLGVARRFFDARMAQSRADLDTLEGMQDRNEDRQFNADTWAPIPHHDGRQ